MTSCLIVQRINAAGIERLQQAGLIPFPVWSHDQADIFRSAADSCVAVITRDAGFSSTAMDSLPVLRVIGVHGVGYDPVDVSHATQLGITVLNTPGTNVRSVAEHTIALLFAVAKQIPTSDRAIRRGDFSGKYNEDLIELDGLTFGVVGFGSIGRATARLAKALGMDVLAYSTQPDNVLAAYGAQRASSLDVLLAASDVVSLHLPAIAATRGLIGRRELRLMRRSAILINTGRGALVDESALVEALLEGAIAAAGLDVFTREPLPPDHPLSALPNVVLTPHTAGSTQASLRRTALAVAEGVINVLAGRRPASLVNPDVWPRRREAKS